MNLTFLYNTKAELLKTRRTSIAWLTVLAAAFMPAINCVILLNRPDIFGSKLTVVPWTVFLHMCWKNTAAILLPLYVILLNNAIAQIEFRNHGWKQVYALPRRYADIFFSKFLVVVVFLFLFMILSNVFVLASGYIAGWLNPVYLFSTHAVPVGNILWLSGRIGLGVLGVLAIQYWLSIRFSNYIIPLATGIGLLVAGLVLMDWDKIIYFPYVYSIFLFFSDAPDRAGTLMPLVTYAVIAFMIFLAIGFAEVYHRREKG
ncbi:ABC transporter permease [Paraflavitalea sp. CAU 1676]|uniref:ABC transporter permease n=1 Tax=Paraflavitalea sp. CAU 1676 TaxID=3032598 RepID=UPI0023DB2F3B|nr:ABC transporter permease [Paraflavitalea sp. CAU 1676]MDF2193191.1 ABC transporter permease [Paraflavitalea sp. CAU 1676]